MRDSYGNGEREGAPVCLEVEVDGRLAPDVAVLLVPRAAEASNRPMEAAAAAVVLSSPTAAAVVRRRGGEVQVPCKCVTESSN